MNGAAEDDTAEKRIVDEGGQFAADGVVDGGDGEGDEEVEEHACGRSFLSSQECGWAERTAGDGLQESLDRHALGSKEG
jgi:hypothetical protein